MARRRDRYASVEAEQRPVDAFDLVRGRAALDRARDEVYERRGLLKASGHLAIAHAPSMSRTRKAMRSARPRSATIARCARWSRG